MLQEVPKEINMEDAESTKKPRTSVSEENFTDVRKKLDKDRQMTCR